MADTKKKPTPPPAAGKENKRTRRTKPIRLVDLIPATDVSGGSRTVFGGNQPDGEKGSGETPGEPEI